MSTSAINSSSSGYGIPSTYSPNSTSTSSPVNVNTIETALGMTSSIDTASLAKNLVNAVSQPQSDQINADIAKQNAKIAGYTAINSALAQLSSAFTTLDNNVNYQNYSATVGNTSVVNVTAATTATPGQHSLTVNTLAQAQISTLGGSYANPNSVDASLPSSFSIQLGSGLPTTVTPTTQTPQGIADAINKANLGVSASVVDTGTGSSPYQIVLTGTSGLANAFKVTVSSTVSNADGSTSTNVNNILNVPDEQSAQDATFSLDGLKYARPSNIISDALSGATLSLQGTGNSSINLTLNTSQVTTNLNNLVTAYNSLQTVINNASTPGNTTAGYGGSLTQDTAISMIRDQVLAAFQKNPSYTTNGQTTTLPSLADMGITVQQDGTMAIDSTVMANELNTNYTKVVQAMNGNTAGIDGLLPQPGIAGAALNTLQTLTSSTGVLVSNQNNAKSVITQDNTNLTNLNTRMASMLKNYTAQFAQMSAILAQAASTKSQLTAIYNPPSKSN